MSRAYYVVRRDGEDVARGTDEQVAARLGLSPSTVRHYACPSYRAHGPIGGLEFERVRDGATGRPQVHLSRDLGPYMMTLIRACADGELTAPEAARRAHVHRTTMERYVRLYLDGDRS